MPCVVKVALSFLGCSTAIIHMVVKGLFKLLKLLERCSTAHLHMVVKNVRSIDVC